MSRRRPPISKKVLAELHARVRSGEPSSSPKTPWTERLGSWLLMSSLVAFGLWILGGLVVACLDWFTHSDLLPAWSASLLGVVVLFLLGWICQLGTTAPLRSALAIAGCLLAIGIGLDLHVGPVSLRTEDIWFSGFWFLWSLDQIVVLWASPNEPGRWRIALYVAISLFSGLICIVRLWPMFLPSLSLILTSQRVREVNVLMAVLLYFLVNPSVQRQFRDPSR